MKKVFLVPILLASVLLVLTTPAAATTKTSDLVFRLFDRYDLVALPEVHRAKEVHEFLRALIRDPRMAKYGVTNVVVEFGNAKYQDVADKYLFGGEVEAAEVQKIWRDTTQFLVWDSPLYEEFFRTVREVNTHRPRAKKIRVILGDPPIGWEIVHTRTDYERYADRDLFFAEVVEREVLKKGKKALLIAGGMHLIGSREPKKEVSDKRRAAGDLLHRRHPGKLFVFWNAAAPIPDLECATLCAVIVSGSRFANESFAPFAPRGVLMRKMINGEAQWVPLESSDWPTTAEMTDGLIYYGASMTTVEPDVAVYQDRSYVKELHRRAAILSDVYGMDFGQQLDSVLSRGQLP